MKVLFVASECAPFVKTGGLADVISALPKALRDLNVDARILLPGYPQVLDALSGKKTLNREMDGLGAPGRLVSGKADGQDLLVLDAPTCFDREGNPYLGPNGSDWPDNWRRFGALCQTAAAIATGTAGRFRPDIVHTHDWQAGLTPLYLKNQNGPPSIATIHNIAFQGVFARQTIAPLGLPADEFNVDGYEFYGSVSFLKAALNYADRITTVSPTYAREIMTTDFGFGLEGVLRARRADVCGILNGIDLTAWNPGADPAIAAPYTARKPKGKRENRLALQTRFGLTDDATSPIFCVVSRLSDQKGIDLLIAALPRLLAAGGRLVVLGSGDRTLEAALSKAASDHEGRVGVVIGYDEALSHLMQAGSDAIIIPSRFEPCGLTQLYGLRYGTLPVVARTGGLADTIIDLNEASLAVKSGTGFQFSPTTADALGDAVERAISLFADPERWTKAMARAMKHPVGWDVSAARYLDLYRELAKST